MELTGNENIKPSAAEESFEERFARLTEERRQEKETARNDLRRSRSSIPLSPQQKTADEYAIYRAKAAAAHYKPKRRVTEGAIHRTIRLVRSLRVVNKEIKSREYMTKEKARSMRSAVVHDAWGPLCAAVSDAADDFWNFLCGLFSDLGDIIVFILDLIVRIGYYLGSFGLFVWDHFWDLRLKLDAHKKGVFQVFAGFITAIALILVLINSVSAYNYYYFGRYLGTVRSKQDVYQTIEILGNKLAEANGAKIDLNVKNDITFEKEYGFNMEVDSPDDILNTITNMKDIHVAGYAVAVDGVNKVYLDTKDEAESVIRGVREAFAPVKENVEYLSVSFVQSVTIEDANVQLGDLWKPAEAVTFLTTGSRSGIDEDTVPIIDVNSVERATLTESIPYGIKYRSNSSLYQDELSLISVGKEGRNEVIAQITRTNGKETERVVESTRRVANPVDEVYYRGTKPIPERVGTGTWLWPVAGRYTLSSRFGSRFLGSIHKGIDIPAPTGTKIYCADGGTVTFAGWNTYTGYTLIINHGGLYETKYGHCSKLLVKQGAQVYQGQNIALIGATGSAATGPHLHFEVHYNGKAIDPMKLTYQ